MKKILLFAIALSITGLVAGCATTDKNEINALESRISSLERKTVASEPQEMTSEEAVSTTQEQATEVAAPETPSKEDIQAALKNAGYYDGTVDGKFGPKTQKAIQDFQAANELKVDGKVGPNTWNKLKKFYVAPEK